MTHKIIRFKVGVNVEDIHPHLWLHLGMIASWHMHYTDQPLWVTSLRRKWIIDASKSWHSPNPYVVTDNLARAADLRVWHLLNAFGHSGASRFGSLIQDRIGNEIGVLVEPDWMTPTQLARRGGLARISAHIHVQSKPTKLLYRLGA